jgi:hypothetical protein
MGYRIGVCTSCGKRKKLVTFYDECGVCELTLRENREKARAKAKKPRKRKKGGK